MLCCLKMNLTMEKTSEKETARPSMRLVTILR